MLIDITRLCIQDLVISRISLRILDGPHVLVLVGRVLVRVTSHIGLIDTRIYALYVRVFRQHNVEIHTCVSLRTVHEITYIDGGYHPRHVS